MVQLPKPFVIEVARGSLRNSSVSDPVFPLGGLENVGDAEIEGGANPDRTCEIGVFRILPRPTKIEHVWAYEARELGRGRSLRLKSPKTYIGVFLLMPSKMSSKALPKATLLPRYSSP